MARKKVVLIIVEGPSDETALGVILTKIFDINKVHVEITHGDITSKTGVTPQNILTKITDVIKKYADSMRLNKRDFQEVIHIIDTDGAYVPDEYVIENPYAIKPHYTSTGIQTAYPQKIRERNLNKRNNLNKLYKTDNVWGNIPYRAYYMSCNLDHVLYEKMNSSDEEKETDAYRFASLFENNIDGFIEFITKPEFSATSDFQRSWEFIKEDFHSLERHTNLGICFIDITNQNK